MKAAAAEVLASRRKTSELAPGERRVTQLLREIMEEGRAQLPRPVRRELFSGLREAGQFRRLCDYLRELPDIVLATGSWPPVITKKRLVPAAKVAGPGSPARRWTG